MRNTSKISNSQITAVVSSCFLSFSFYSKDTNSVHGVNCVGVRAKIAAIDFGVKLKSKSSFECMVVSYRKQLKSK